MCWMTIQLTFFCSSVCEARLSSVCTLVWKYRPRTQSRQAKMRYCDSRHSWQYVYVLADIVWLLMSIRSIRRRLVCLLTTPSCIGINMPSKIFWQRVQLGTTVRSPMKNATVPSGKVTFGIRTNAMLANRYIFVDVLPFNTHNIILIRSSVIITITSRSNMSVNILLILMNTIEKRTLMLKMTTSQTLTRKHDDHGVFVQAIFSLDRITAKYPSKL